MSIEAIKSRLGSIGPRARDNLPGSVRRILDEDMPRLIAVAEAARTRNPLGEDEYYKMSAAQKELDDTLAALESSPLRPSMAARIQIASELLDPPVDTETGEKPEPLITQEQAREILDLPAAARAGS